VFFPLQNAVCFVILTYVVSVLFTFYIQGVLKLKKNTSGAKRLIYFKSHVESDETREEYQRTVWKARSWPSLLGILFKWSLRKIKIYFIEG
jgi:hypothetical protein